MDEWRAQLRNVVAGWGLSPEDQAGIVDELEQHLEQELAELTPTIGAHEALARILAQVNDPALRMAAVRPRHVPAASVAHARAHTHTHTRGWETFTRDLRHGWRALRLHPRSTIAASVALALGIGLTTVMFTIIYGLLLRGLPFEHADRIAMIQEANPSTGETEISLSTHEYFAYRDAQQSFETFGAWTPTTLNLSGDERPERIDAARVTASALSLTRVLPLLGRSFRADDEKPGGALVILLSHGVWRDRYASDPHVIGRAVRINGQPATVVGVMPPGFGFPRDAKLWVPLRLDPTAAPWGKGEHVIGVGRLRATVSMARAGIDLAGIARRMETDHPDVNKGVQAVVQPFIRATIPARVYALLYAMFGAVLMVFLVACTNVANLLLARALSRTKEVAIRVAMGASRVAIARQFLVEALVLSLVSAGAGALVAWGGLAAFQRAIAGQVPFWADFRLHPQVFLFIALIALLASIVAGLLPAITAARSDVTDVLKDQAFGSTTRRSGRLSRSLVMFELALSSALLVVAALITRSVVNLRTLEPGFRTAGIMTGRISLPLRDAALQRAFFSRLDAEIARLPGALATSVSTNLPGPGWRGRTIAVEGQTYPRPNSFPSVRSLAVSPGFFRTFGLSALRGRLLGEEDRDGALPVAVVNQRFVDRFLANADPIGHRINLSPDDSVASWVTIVGIVPNLYASDQGSVIRNAPWPAEVLTAFAQQASASAAIAIRTDGDPSRLAEPLRALVATLDADLPVYSLASMADAVAQSRWEVRIFGGLFVVFGVVALALASIGLYAVLSFAVIRREKEMGVRMALGATTSDILRLVLKGAALLLAIGVPIGVWAGVGIARLARAVLYDVVPGDPATLTIVVVTLAATGMAASLAPAWRASRVDPVRNLRAE